ncbi:helix-turn-helix transcriptional regulator [uncultured Paracoccus sp.]|uniref:helix-turn-helix transcriptional regulator n=1 Tax=uncultured Paracoccus sp. TaxID=189685 RepID=UPI0025FBF080|nr:helix-turn-helix transcriptional regulator [uncultured Paracoccus sp.]
MASVRMLARFLGPDIQVVQVDSPRRIDPPHPRFPATPHSGPLDLTPRPVRDRPFRNLDLTLRQQEVLECVMQGLTNKEVARVLGISPATVRTHVSSLMRAMGVTSRTAAATLAAKLAQGNPR